MKCIDIFPAVSADKSSFLDKATELDLATRWKRGDVEARNQIILAHQPLALRIARAYAATYGLDADDLLGDAQLGLLRAADKFDPSLGNRFSTYAQNWIDAKVRATCAKPAAGMTPGRSKTARPALFRLDAPVAPDDPENVQTGHDVKADPNGVTAGDIIEALDVDKARAAIRTIKLSDRNRRIVEARLADQPVAEIAAEHGLTPQRIDQIWSDFFAKAVKAKGKAGPATWFEWSDRPPEELPLNVRHLDQAAPEWWQSMQRCWPSDRASFRTERRVEVVPGPARMPLVQSRW